ncbi:calcium-binding protein [Nitrosomonas sp. sh817]|uniref:calcium-binding protein n=1 Tax=Nitrosomonas sp. sh817 TaxID=3070658 RepID=UPI0027DC041F|nr:calcium-binding protein [Nitrosomonas sp. sh817]WMJ08483.1 calcium-binding protein [Nitrosomonas sp. sh817]
MTFHVFHLNEVYSNADGTIQFIEFMGDADGQNLWAGRTITSTDGSITKTYNITANLPNAATLNKTVLVATQGFADLGIVTPDYIIPNGFLFLSGGTVNFPGMDDGRLSYANLPVDGVTSLNPDSSTGINSPKNFAGNTGTVPSNIFTGTDGSDNLTGTSGDDFIVAFGGNDTLTGNSGNDKLSGGFGADTAIFSSSRVNYTVAGTSTGFSVSGPDGNDTLLGIERFRFTDKKIAVDLGDGQSANNTARLIGAAFDAPTIAQHPDYVGIGLNLFDSGQSMLAVSQLVVGILGLSNDAFVDKVYQNVVGSLPSASEHDFYVKLLSGSGGTLSQAQLLEIAANTDINEVNINLTGLQQTGVEFI